MSSVAESSSAIELTNDGTLSSGVSDTGPAANAGACSERCFAEQHCGAYTWVSPEPADPELRPLAQHCVLVSSPAAAPRACGAGCGGQFSGRRISSPWPSDGYDRLPTVWFSANATGPNSREMLDLIAKHDLAIVSWGQAMSSEPGRITRDSEKAQAEAATAVRSYLDSVGNNVTVLGVYRQIQIALGLFNVSHEAALEPANANFWLHQLDNASNICGMEPSEGDKRSMWGTLDPFWNFTDQSARDYWLNTFIEVIPSYPQ
jgi:hypothetical protein